MEDRRKPRYRYDARSRQEILDSIPILDPSVSHVIIDECEIVATIHLHTIAFQANFPTFDSANHRIGTILNHLQGAFELAHFDDDVKLAARFWRHILEDDYGDVPADRWDRFVKLTRSVRAAQHLLRRASGREGFKSKWKEDNSLSVLEVEYLTDLAGVYWHSLQRKPGRSKSTIGPFVRFAWAAMNPILRDRMPTIDSLNDKWARLRFDATKTGVNEWSVKRFGRHYK
jgi:hypothetical protein